jgi:glycosyltransferase involved in cell wall biosynthesis
MSYGSGDLDPERHDRLSAGNTPLTILMFNYEYPPVGGGGGVLCRDIAEWLAESGHQPVVVTSAYGGLAAHEVSNGVEIRRVSVLGRKERDVASIASMLSYVPAAVRTAMALAGERRFDVVNTYFAIPTGPAGHFVARRLGIGNLLGLMGGDVYDPSKTLSPHKTPLLKQTVRYIIGHADRVVAVSTDIVRRAHEYYGLTREIHAVPLGIKPGMCPQSVRRDRDDGRPLTLCTVGRLVPRKDVVSLVHIFSRVLTTTPARLVVVGDGPEHDAIETAAARLGCSGEVVLAGRVSDEEKFRLLAESDLYVSTALHEGFGIVFLEAMECGLPVICYDRGGQTDFLENGVTGAVVGLGDTRSFEAAILRFLEDPALRRRVSGHNREYAKRFYISECAGAYLRLMREAMRA